MRHTTASRRGTDREQAEPHTPVRGPRFPAGSPGALQRTIGNAAVARMIARERGRDRKAPAPGGREATGGDATRGEVAGEAAVREAARAAGRGGRRLPGGVRTTMENAFGTSLDHVRVSVDERAAASIDAKAYTVGHTIVVQNASVLRDTETMAHEIHHTTQHDAPAGLSDPDGRWEREASDVGARVARGQRVQCAADGGAGREGDAVQRRVGFEFESQWRVRDHKDLTEEDEQNYHDEVAEQKALGGAQILVMLTAPRSAHASRLLDEPEQATPAQDLRDSWLAPLAGGNRGEYQLTDEGAARIDRLRQESPEEYEKLLPEAQHALRTKKVIREPPVRGRDIPKADSVGGGRNYQLTSDVSPTGGSGLEWVTDPLNTRDEAVEVMDTITAVSAALDSRQGEESFPLDDVVVEGFTANPGIMVFPMGGALDYTPQMTGGFKLGELPRLVEYLNAPAKAPGLLGRAAHDRRKEAQQDLHREGIGKVDGIRRTARELADALPEEATGGQPTDGLVGLITLIGSYLDYGTRLEGSGNSKSIAGGLMSRTSFAHNFTLLPHPLRVYFRTKPAEFVTFALQAAGLPVDGTDPLYNTAVEHGDAGRRERRQIPLTRAEWLKGIPVGQDLLRNYKHLTEAEKIQVGDRKDDWDHIHSSLGALGSVDDKVGKPGSEEVALVAELRRIPGGARTADLKPLALAAFDLVQRLNEGKSLDYKKKR